MCRLIQRKYWIGRVSEAQNIHISQKAIERKGKLRRKPRLIKFKRCCAFKNCDRLVVSGVHKIIQNMNRIVFHDYCILIRMFVCCFKLFSHWTSSFRFAMLHYRCGFWLCICHPSPLNSFDAITTFHDTSTGELCVPRRHCSIHRAHSQ